MYAWLFFFAFRFGRGNRPNIELVHAFSMHGRSVSIYLSYPPVYTIPVSIVDGTILKYCFIETDCNKRTPSGRMLMDFTNFPLHLLVCDFVRMSFTISNIGSVNYIRNCLMDFSSWPRAANPWQLNITYFNINLRIRTELADLWATIIHELIQMFLEPSGRSPKHELCEAFHPMPTMQWYFGNERKTPPPRHFPAYYIYHLFTEIKRSSFFKLASLLDSLPTRMTCHLRAYPC